MGKKYYLIKMNGAVGRFAYKSDFIKFYVFWFKTDRDARRFADNVDAEFAVADGSMVTVGIGV